MQLMRITPVLLSLLAGVGVTATAATLSAPALGTPSSAFQEKTADAASKDTKKEDKAEKITVWVLDAAGKG